MTSFLLPIHGVPALVATSNFKEVYTTEEMSQMFSSEVWKVQNVMRLTGNPAEAKKCRSHIHDLEQMPKKDNFIIPTSDFVVVCSFWFCKSLVKLFSPFIGQLVFCSLTWKRFLLLLPTVYPAPLWSYKVRWRRGRVVKALVDGQGLVMALMAISWPGHTSK